MRNRLQKGALVFFLENFFKNAKQFYSIKKLLDIKHVHTKFYLISRPFYETHIFFLIKATNHIYIIFIQINPIHKHNFLYIQYNMIFFFFSFEISLYTNLFALNITNTNNNAHNFLKMLPTDNEANISKKISYKMIIAIT